MSEETLQERQDNEIEALKAIFCDDLVDNRQAIAWKVWRPLDLMLTLHPLHSSSVAGSHCSVTLHIKCCENYPNKPPSLSLHKIQGLSNENGAKLLTELEELATKSCGEVMIFELAQHVQNFLHAFNKPTLSFYDEMLERRNEMERLKLHDQQVKENEERQKMKDEIQKRQEILKGAGRQRLHRTSVSQPEAEGQGDAPELIYYADSAMSPAKKAPKNRTANVACTCSTKGIQILRVTQKNNKKIHVGKCLGHSTNGATTYLAIDADTGDFVVTRKWSLNPATDFQTRNRQMNLIEQDLKAMSRIKHPPLIPYIAMEIQQEVIKRTSVQCVYIFRDFVLGTSLKDLRTKLKTFGDSDGFEAVRLLRHVGIGVLSALSELHSVGVLHRDVRSENVFLNDSGAVKLVGAGLDVRLAEILEGESFCDRQTKTQDIFSAAQLLLSIVSTHEPTHEVPSQLPVAARDFFSRCLTEDEQLQWSADQLLNHGFLKDAPAPPPSGKQHDDGYSGSEDEDKLLVQSFVQSLPSSGHSRLSAEFEVLKWLGKGAFGDVLKVKNKLDGGFYAIKRIKLNPENVQLNKKITREVKLLSRLNHENVVRYYNAWIETMSAVLDDTTDTVSTDPSVVKEPKNQTKKTCPNSMEADLAKLAPGVKLEWSISEAPITKPDAESDSEEDDDNDDDDDDEDEGWFKRLPVTTNLDETSSSIEFEVDTDNQSQTLPSEELPSDPRPPTEHIQQVLYIQMEFCEKNTLRHAIDNGLFMENYRVWKLFREIVEGLAHVHQKGMIHRDLKPVNIFLDSNDHVKIGDFGLATKAFTSLPVVEDKEKPQEEFGGSLTGQIGTALYVAPELLQAGNKVIYNQKVDLYSLGIILFEMCHAPLDTGMERMMVLTELRTREILMSERVERAIDPKALTVIRWLLNHDPSLRPTCAELLSSDTVPRTVASEALSPLLSHALSARGSRPYTRLITECLQQTMPPSVDYTYHTGLRTRPDLALNQIKDTVIQVFKSHGATEFSPPLLMPRARAWDQCPNAVKVMTAFGTVCHLPHDLRLPFARHVAYTEAKSLRRYTVGLVFREKHVDGFHPREIAECAFDIVTPRTGTLWSDAELLLVANKAASAVNLKVSVTLNHTEMLKTLLLCCGVSTDRHRDLYPILVDVRLGRITNLQLQTHLTSLCITNRDIANLLRMMEAEVPVSEVRELVAPLAKKAEWSKALARAVEELESVADNAKALGLECAVTVAPCLAYNATQHSGVFWQMSAVSVEQRTSSKHRSADIIAAGGRYDVLIDEFCVVSRSVQSASTRQASGAAGCSMSLQRMAARAAPADPNPSICVCVWGTAGNSRDGHRAARRAQLARDLWAAGHAVCTLECKSATEAHELSGASIVLLDEDNYFCAICWDDNRVREHRLPYIEVLDFVKQKLGSDSVKSPEGNFGRTISWSDESRDRDKSSPNISVTFITSSEKMTRNSRRLCENQINTQITSSLLRLGVTQLSRSRVCVLALACEAACVRSLAANLDLPSHSRELLGAASCTINSFPRRRKIIEETIEELITMTSTQNNQSRASEEVVLYALYSIPDALCRLLV